MRLLLDLQGAQTESRFRGIGRHTRALAAAVVERGGEHHINVMFNAMLGANLGSLKEQFSRLLPPERILVFDGVSPAAAHDQGNDWRIRASELAREAFIADQKPDVLHIGSLFEGFLDDAVLSIDQTTIRHATCTTLYDLIPLINPELYLAAQGPRRQYYRRAQTLKRSDMLLALSESAKQEAVECLDFDPAQITVTGCGVDARFRRLESAPLRDAVLLRRCGIVRPFVLHVGAVDPRKNVEILLEAFARLPSALRRAHCLSFAGNIPPIEMVRVRALGARFGLGFDEIVFCGMLSDDDLVVLYNACALVVCPSKHEGFGLPALEGMACGAPVLASSSTSHPEVVGNPDQLFDPSVAGALAARMTAILSNPLVATAFREHGIARAAQFTWDEAARRSLQGFEQLHERRSWTPSLTMPAGKGVVGRRPTMAFLSPLPSDRSGIADYSAILLRELARHYEIECVVTGGPLTDEWIIANFVLRDVGWFERHAGRYDRIVYSFGNSHFHSRMVGLLQRFPGTVILHDLFMSDLLEWMANTTEFPPETFIREVYLSHGLSGLLAMRERGVRRIVEQLPCNGFIYRSAIGVIAHSEQAREQARNAFGPRAAEEVEVIPFLRRPAPQMDVQKARTRLGIPRDSFVVCSFGLITSRKDGQKLVSAWAESELGQQPGAMLLFVGQSIDRYGEALLARIARHQGKSHIAITGHVTQAVYQDHLAACDAAVQLRSLSRGETSAAILDCFAAGVPVVANAHGTTNEIPDNALIKISDVFTTIELAGALDCLHNDKALRRQVGEHGRSYLTEMHGSGKVGAAFHAAIERFATNSPAATRRKLIAQVGELAATVAPSEDDLRRFAFAIARNAARIGLRQLLCDVTVLAEQDARTGIQRVVRSVFMTLVRSPPLGFRVEAVRIEQGRYVTAHNFAERVLEVPAAVFPDTEVEFTAGDVFLGVDWVPDRIPDAVAWLKRFRDLGGRVAFVAYDLLPLQMPQHFPDFMGEVTLKWFSSALQVADQFLAISRTVADDVATFASAIGTPSESTLVIDYFHIGSNLAASIPSSGMAPGAELVFSAMRARKTFLMVGTIEPRKGHRQVLQAFDILWRRGVDVCLVIVGKRGWMVEDFAGVVERHAELDRRLFWLHSISDEMLDRVYAASSALVAASAGEGFGLPLVEAAKHEIPLIARDIPVFREVAGEHAFYFDGTEPEDLANAIEQWLELEGSGRAPSSRAMPHVDWQASVDQLLAALFAKEHYRTVTPVLGDAGSREQSFTSA